MPHRKPAGCPPGPQDQSSIRRGYCLARKRCMGVEGEPWDSCNSTGHGESLLGCRTSGARLIGSRGPNRSTTGTEYSREALELAKRRLSQSAALDEGHLTSGMYDAGADWKAGDTQSARVEAKVPMDGPGGDGSERLIKCVEYRPPLPRRVRGGCEFWERGRVVGGCEHAGRWICVASIQSFHRSSCSSGTLA